MSSPGYGSLPVVIDPTAWGGRTISPPGSLTIDTIQGQIANQLQDFFSQGNLSIPVYVWPNFDLDTWWKGSAIAFVLISYEASQLSKPQSTSSMVQEKTLRFKFHVEARQTAWALTGTGSVYALINAIEAALSGFQPQGCRNAYFTEETFGEQKNDGRIWLFDLTYNVLTQSPKLLPQYALAELVQATFNITPSGDAVIVKPDEPAPINE